MDILILDLPWPPSINHYYGFVGAKRFIDKPGREFRKTVHEIVLSTMNKPDLKDKRLSMKIEVYPPDNRRRDLDNIVKSLADSLQHAGVYNDDCMIDELLVYRMHKRRGRVVVTIKSLMPTVMQLDEQ